MAKSAIKQTLIAEWRAVLGRISDALEEAQARVEDGETTTRPVGLLDDLDDLLEDIESDVGEIMTSVRDELARLDREEQKTSRLRPA